MNKKKTKYFISGIILSLFILFIPFFTGKARRYIENLRFEKYVNELFLHDVSSDSLTLHYTLSNPEALNIRPAAPSLGSWSPRQELQIRSILENRLSTLKDFNADCLSPENKLTRNILILDLSTELSPENREIFKEYLSPCLGIQAQLPILLAEYIFRDEQDIKNYLSILSSTDTYFDSILSFEKMKSQKGTFMSDESADRVIRQCTDFIQNPENNYLIPVFNEKLSQMKNITTKQKKYYSLQHSKILSDHFIPAYKKIISELSSLKGTGNNAGGLSSMPGGRDYYCYLLKSSCGLYENVTSIQKRLLKQLEEDMYEYKMLTEKNPQAVMKMFQDEFDFPYAGQSPTQLLDTLRKIQQKDFPAVIDTSYKVKYVHKDLKAYLSPAFYLTPPIDTLSPNTIYINPDSALKGVSLFTTLAHEGFPGHLYQTVYFASTEAPPIRHLLNMGGYVEGWATYVESYIHTYGRTSPDLARMDWLGRSMNLCVLSLLDTGIHYNGWDLERTGKFLSTLKICDPAMQKEIYYTILESPANYPKYYMGYLHFEDLKNDCRKRYKDQFNLKTFHEKVLKAGPCPFPVLEQTVKEELDLIELK